MKFLYVALYSILIIGMSNIGAQTKINNNDTSKHNGSATNQVVLDTLTYKVYGMDCPGCHSALEKQINKLSSVKHSKADWVKQEVRIIVNKDSIIKEDTLFERIKSANFTPGVRVTK